jgi:membrane protease subunit (stomatin/prohibitin family)
MFNWFKKKIELEKDTDTMSSVNYNNGLKLGSEIIVPENFECLIFNKGKCYHSINSGKYKVEPKVFPDLISSQQKLKIKLKYVRCVCHYINKSTQKLEIKFKKQPFEITFTINDSIKFAELILLYSYKVDNDYVMHTLTDMFCELLSYNKGNYKQINSTSLENFGIIINSFTPITKKDSIFKSKSRNLIKEPCIDNTNQSQSVINSSANLNETKTNDKELPTSADTPSIKQSTNHCPNCNNTSKFKTTYCLHCGYKLE